MLSDLTSKQKELANYMSELSEEAYNATWMLNLEYELWKLMNGRILTYGRLKVSSQIKQKLKGLSKNIEGWIYYDDKSEETYISTKGWIQKFKNYH